MKKLITTLFFCLLASACTPSLKSVDMLDAYSVYQTAPGAESAIFDYVNGDEATLQALEAPVSAVRALHGQLDTTEAFVDFIERRPDSVVQLGDYRQQIIKALRDHAARTGDPVPDEIKQFDFRAGTVYQVLLLAAERQDRSVKVQKYSELLLHVLALKHGIAF